MLEMRQKWIVFLYYRSRNITKLLSQEEVIKVCPSKNKDNVYVY